MSVGGRTNKDREHGGVVQRGNCLGGGWQTVEFFACTILCRAFSTTASAAGGDNAAPA